MNVNEALEQLKQDKTLRCKGWSGVFSMYGNTITFNCGELGCCDFEWFIEEFLKEFNGEEFINL